MNRNGGRISRWVRTFVSASVLLGSPGVALVRSSAPASAASTPEYSVTPGPVSVSEGGPAYSVVVSLTEPAATDVHFSMNGGSATLGSDYTANLDATSSFTIPAGQTSYTLTITPIDDNEPESTEYLSTQLSSQDANPAPGSTVSVTLLLDNEPPQLKLSTQNPMEGPYDTVFVDFLGLFAGPVTFDYAVTDGAGVSVFPGPSQTRRGSITDAQNSLGIQVYAPFDANNVGESRIVTISNVSPSTVAVPAAQTYFIDDILSATIAPTAPLATGARVTFNIDYLAAVDSNFGAIDRFAPTIAATGLVAPTVESANGWLCNVVSETVECTGDGFWDAGVHRTIAVSFLVPDQFSELCNSGPCTDVTFGPNTFGPRTLVQTFPVVEGGGGTPVVSVGNVSKQEGTASSATVFSVPVTITPPFAQDRTVNWTLVNTTTDNADFVATSGTILLPGGASNATIDLAVVADSVSEADETASLSLQGFSTTALITILNDDAIPVDGTIAGTVLLPSGPGASAVDVTVSTTTGTIQRTTTTAADGSYSFVGLPPGEYLAVFDPRPGPLLYHWWYNNRSDPSAYFLSSETGGAQRSSATAIVVSANATTTVTATLRGYGTIAGSVGAAPPNTLVLAKRSTPVLTKQTQAGSDGSYVIEGLPAGSYTVSFLPTAASGALQQFYNNATTESAAQAISVVEGEAVTGIDYIAPLLAHVQGRVLDTTGAPYPSVKLTFRLLDGSGQFLAGPITGADGTYTADLPPADYRVEFDAPGSNTSATAYVYGNTATCAPTAPFSCGAVVHVVGGTTLALSDQTVPHHGVLHGIVTGLDGQPLAGVSVSAIAKNGNGAVVTGGSANTDSTGMYSINLVPTVPSTPYSYVVSATAPGALGLPLLFFDNAATEASATRVSVIAGADIKADFNFGLGGRIQGTVTHNGAALPGAVVQVLAPGVVPTPQATVGLDGTYTIRNLRPGSYKVLFTPPDPATISAEYWNDTRDPTLATLVTIAGSEMVGGINADLGSKTATLTGVVRGLDGTPIGGAVVTVILGTDSMVGFATTDGSGQYSFAAHPDTFVIHACGPAPLGCNYYGSTFDQRGSATQVAASSGSTITGLDITLGGVGEALVTLLDIDGSPYENPVNISFFGPINATAVSHGRNTYIAELPVGSYTMYIDAGTPYLPQWWNDSFVAGAATPLVIAAGQGTPAEVTLALNRGFAGFVAGLSGAPLDGVQAIAVQVDTGLNHPPFTWHATSGFACNGSPMPGAYCFPTTFPGTYSVSFSKDGYIPTNLDVSPADGIADSVVVGRANQLPAQPVMRMAALPVAPETSIVSGPASLTASTTASFVVSSDNTAATFECALDSAAFASCPNPVTYTSLSSGAHQLQVRAVAAGGTDATPAVHRWSVLAVTVTGPPTVAEGTATVFTATPQGSSAAATITWDTNADGIFNDGSGATVSVADVDGTSATNELTVQASVTEAGATATSAKTTTDITNVVPKVTISGVPTTSTAGATLTATIIGTDVAADTPSLQYALVCGTGTPTYGSVSTLRCPTAATAGSYVITAYVRDKDGGVGTAVATVAVAAVGTPPGTPRSVSSTGKPSSVQVTWTAPARGSAPTGYTITCKAGTSTAAVTVGVAQPLTATVPNLTNGTTYSCTVTATNASGSGPASAPSSATPRTTPDAPVLLTAQRGASSITLTWTPPISNGGAPIQRFTASCTPTLSGTSRSATASATATSVVVTGLANGASYRCSVLARNSVGNGPVSNTLEATPADLPGSPTSQGIRAGNRSAVLTFGAPANTGGLPITSYTVTCTPSAASGRPVVTASGQTSPITINTLTNGTTYSCAVTATTEAGTGGPSRSLTVIPR
jgi:Fibronectin type III domain/Carboxypeptidase regulatory-like domain/Calx-beta domain